MKKLESILLTAINFSIKSVLGLTSAFIMLSIVLFFCKCSPSPEEQKKARLDSLSKALDLGIKNTQIKLTHDTNELNRQIKRNKAGL